MKKIYIILTQPSTIIANSIQLFTHDEFNHSSICINSDFKRFFSFGRLYKNFFWPGGFVIENAFTHVFGKLKKVSCMILELEVSNEQYEIIKKEINKFIENKKNYKYDFLNLFFAKTNIKFKNKCDNRYFCSSFVAHILNIAKIDLPHPIEKMKPYDFTLLKNTIVYYKGDLKKIGGQIMNDELNCLIN